MRTTIGNTDELAMIALSPAVDGDTAREYSTQLLLQINGLLNANLGVGGYIERARLVEYFSDGSRVATKCLSDVILFTALSGLQFGPPLPITFLQPVSDNDQRLHTEFMNRWGQPDALTFSGLYKIFELVRASDRELVKAKHFDDRLRLFAHTANHSDTGLDARHAASPGAPPPSSLAISQAVSLIRELYDEFARRRGWEVPDA
ncbi:hypothetical protein [Paraburkholderia sp. J41]|uniref:hypothetical protein n=1 Tax=Paraburkholderia sp. J41 TaxID=2805433 RepID=UPI002AC365C3|nr:hypothetical protein [Paraburkholderia sp. J41]